MVVVYKDIFFANIPGIDNGECHLDLYLPNTLQTKDYILEQEHSDRNIFAEDKGHGGIKESKNVKKNTSGSQGFHKPKQTYSVSHVDGDVKADGDMLAFGDEVTGDADTKESYSENNSSVPFVLFIHGGGWRRGGRISWKHYIYSDVNFLVAFIQYCKGLFSNIGETLAENNVACAVISYPLTEAGPLILLLEMILSYLNSSVFVFLSSLPFLLILTLIRTLTQDSHINTWDLLFNEHTSSASSVSMIVSIAMLVTNLTTSLLFFIRRTQFEISTTRIRMFSAMITVCCLVSYQSNSRVIVFVISTLALNQVMIFNHRFKRHGASYEHQIDAVAQAVRWAKRFSKETGYTDAARLYLMGHSAGGHLATLSAFDESALSSASCSSDLKGIISVSGIYDLLMLNKHLLRPVYLEPTFGTSPTTWFDASPQHLAKRTKDISTMPTFLLMLAENDVFLKSQSFRFAQTLEDLRYKCRHVEISKTNHITIMTDTRTSEGTTMSYVLDFVS